MLGISRLYQPDSSRIVWSMYAPLWIPRDIRYGRLDLSRSRQDELRCTEGRTPRGSEAIFSLSVLFVLHRIVDKKNLIFISSKAAFRFLFFSLTLER